MKIELKREFFSIIQPRSKRVYAYLLMMVHNHNDAEDLLQETASASKAVQLDISIPAAVRFLTLAVTESDDTSAYDGALFAQPEPVLESTGK